MPAPARFDLAAELARFATHPEPALLSPGLLGLARKVEPLRPALDATLADPLHRALAGLGPAPDPAAEADPARALWAATARQDAGQAVDPALARRLAEAVADDPALAVPGLRLWVRADPARERAARAALSEQELPYVFPGDLHPLSIELLASADRVMTALHVDWARKLTAWVAEALPADARAMGLWFWPHLRFLDERELIKPLRQLERPRRAPPGAAGLAFAYQHRIGLDYGPALMRADPQSRLVAAIAIASDAA